MVTFVLAFVAGLVVGWHVPQPSWAKKAEEEVISAAAVVKSKTERKKQIK